MPGIVNRLGVWVQRLDSVQSTGRQSGFAARARMRIEALGSQRAAWGDRRCAGGAGVYLALGLRHQLRGVDYVADHRQVCVGAPGAYGCRQEHARIQSNPAKRSMGISLPYEGGSKDSTTAR